MSRESAIGVRRNSDDWAHDRTMSQVQQTESVKTRLLRLLICGACERVKEAEKRERTRHE
jgi:hypothetical protein